MDEHNGGPPETGGPPRTPSRQAESSRPGYDETDRLHQRRQDAHADRELRIAWLTVHAELLHGVDQGGQLSAQLLDLRDLLDTLQAEGRWDQ